MWIRAVAKRVVKAVARGPGVVGMGVGGAGEGVREGEGIVVGVLVGWVVVVGWLCC